MGKSCITYLLTNNINNNNYNNTFPSVSLHKRSISDVIEKGVDCKRCATGVLYIVKSSSIDFLPLENVE